MKQLLENIIKEWQNRTLPEIITRDINLKDYLSLKVRKIITVVGFRRTGKTFLLLDLAKKIGQKNAIYLNLEDERLPRKTEVLTIFLDLLEEFFPKKPLILLLDEIQNIPNWHLWAKRVIETTPYQLFISGSSSKLSSFELPTQLRGRSLTVKVQPLTFNEFFAFKKLKNNDLPKQKILSLLREYLYYGGFPEIVLSDEGKKPLILDEYYQTFLRKDIIERYKIRGEEELKILIQLLLNSPYFTYSSLAKSLKLAGFSTGKATLIRYLQYLKEAFFFQEILLGKKSVKNRLKAPKKPFFIDNYFLSRFSTQFFQNLGYLMENSVAQKLNFKEKKFYYWKDYQDKEVDFVVHNQEKTESLIQVSYINNPVEIKPREINSLIKAQKFFPTKNLYLITWDFEGELNLKQKIFCFPLYKWLMA